MLWCVGDGAANIINHFGMIDSYNGQRWRRSEHGIVGVVQLILLTISVWLTALPGNDDAAWLEHSSAIVGVVQQILLTISVWQL
jgi:hypothetical protein